MSPNNVGIVGISGRGRLKTEFVNVCRIGIVRIRMRCIRLSFVSMLECDSGSYIMVPHKSTEVPHKDTNYVKNEFWN